MNATPPIPTLADLPSPPPAKTGWPWTTAGAPLPATMPDGSHWPRITVVTPSFNQGQYIEETIRSILLQGYPNLEYIIIDGGSTDHSVEIIRKYEPWLTYWVSEPDQGQAHAINKGLARATGEIFNFINSDDYLTSNALSIIATNFGDAHVLAGVVRNFDHGTGEANLIHNANLSVASYHGIPAVPSSRRRPPRFEFHQPGVWLRTSRLQTCQGFDIMFHYVFDIELTLRYLNRFPNVQYVADTLVNFRLHAVSKTLLSTKGTDYFAHERYELLRKHSQLDEFAQYHRQILLELRRICWYRELQALLTLSGRSAWQRRLDIVQMVLKDPQIRISRYTLGHLRRC